MIRTLTLIALVALVGCEAPAFVDALFGVTPDGGVAPGPAPAETAGSLFGPWGVAGATLLTAAYQSWTKHKDKKDWVGAAKQLGADAYEKYGSFSNADKKRLDEDIKGMIPVKYQKYYDLGKELAK